MYIRIAIILCLTLFLAPVVNARIVFASSRSGNYEIYTMDDDGSNLQRLTNNPLRDAKPRWSPNGKQIVFQRWVNMRENQRKHLFIMNADGTNERQLTEPHPNGRDTSPMFSPDGKSILFYRYRGWEDRGLYIMSLESGAIKKIYDMSVNDAVFTPDGKHITFSNVGVVGNVNGINVHIMDIRGKKVRELLPSIPVGQNIMRRFASFSPNGKQLLYTQFEYENELKQLDNGRGRTFFPIAFRIIISDRNGNNPRPLNIPKDWMIDSLVWMDNGKSVLFCADADYDIQQAWGDPERTFDIYRYDIAKRKFMQLTTHPKQDISVDWISDDVLPVSPKGKKQTQWGALKSFLPASREVFKVFTSGLLFFVPN